MPDEDDAPPQPQGRGTIGPREIRVGRYLVHKEDLLERGHVIAAPQWMSSLPIDVLKEGRPMRDVEAILAAAGEALRPFLQQAFDAGKAEGRREAVDEFKAKIAAIWDDEVDRAASSQTDSLTAAVHKIERMPRYADRGQASQSAS